MTGPSHLALEQGINFRDMGGIQGRDGRKIRSGCLFRSGALSELSDTDLARLTELGPIQVVDYRDRHESAQDPDRLWAGAVYHSLPANPVVAQMGAGLDSLIEEAIHQVEPDAFMQNIYRLLPFNNPAYRQLSVLLRHPHTSALIQHCAVGKDRTGIGSALLLFALGASRESIMQDYLLTQQRLAPFRDKTLSRFASRLDQQSLQKLYRLLSVDQVWMQTALNEIDRRYGTPAAWLAEEYQLDDTACEALQHRFLQP